MTCNSNFLIYSPWALQPTFRSHKLLQTLWSTFEFGLFLYMMWTSHVDHGCIHNWSIQKGKKIIAKSHWISTFIGCFITNLITYNYILFYYYLGEYIGINIWLKIITIKKVSLKCFEMRFKNDVSCYAISSKRTHLRQSKLFFQITSYFNKKWNGIFFIWWHKVK
jgi:hypothetical protein